MAINNNADNFTKFTVMVGDKAVGQISFFNSAVAIDASDAESATKLVSHGSIVEYKAAERKSAPSVSDLLK